MFSRSGAHSVVLIEIVVGLPIFFLLSSYKIKSNTSEYQRGRAFSLHNYNQGGGMKVGQKKTRRKKQVNTTRL